METTVKKNVIYKGKIITVRRDEALAYNGRPCVREVVEHMGGVCVLPLLDDGRALCVRQFRYPYMEDVLEFPAGKLEPGEDPRVCGERELAEETGRTAGEFVYMGEMYPSPGYLSEKIYLYIARGLKSCEASPDDDESLTLEAYSLTELTEMALNGTLKDAKTLALLFKALALENTRATREFFNSPN